MACEETRRDNTEVVLLWAMKQKKERAFTALWMSFELLSVSQRGEKDRKYQMASTGSKVMITPSCSYKIIRSVPTLNQLLKVIDKEREKVDSIQFR